MVNTSIQDVFYFFEEEFGEKLSYEAIFFVILQKIYRVIYYQRLSDEEILSGFREGDADIIREYFYGNCQVGYNIFDQRYQLREKENLDFMSLAHQYALYLMEHDWKPLEDHSPNVSLKTWLINGFRYVVLDALKWYRKEYGSITAVRPISPTASLGPSWVRAWVCRARAMPSRRCRAVLRPSARMWTSLSRSPRSTLPSPSS